MELHPEESAGVVALLGRLMANLKQAEESAAAALAENAALKEQLDRIDHPGEEP